MSIPDLSLFSALASSLDSNQANLQQVEQQLATGTQVNQPSDNPTAFSGGVLLKAQASAVANDLLLGQQVQSQLNTADSALSIVGNAINSAITIATQGANGSESSTAMAALGAQVQSIQQQVIGAANSQYGGSYLFGGDQVQTAPYDSAGNYAGSGATNAVTFGNGTSVQNNFNGLAIFGDNSTGVIATLGALATALNSGNQAGAAAALTPLQTGLSTIATARGVLGGGLTSANNIVTDAGSQSITIQADLQNLIGTDIPTAAMKQQEALLQQQALVSLGSGLAKIPLINILA